MSGFPPATRVVEDVLAVKGCLPLNCSVVGGRIAPALSPIKQSGAVPVNPTCIRYCAGVERYFLWSENKVYVSSSGTSFSALAALTARSPFIIEERTAEGSRALICGDDTAILHTGAYQTADDFSGNLSCGAMRCGRLFGVDRTDGFLLRWSGAGGALDWAEGIAGAGWVYPDAAFGKILDVCEFSDTLVLIRENGLSVMSAYGTPENFALRGNYPLPRIVARTAAVAGDRLYVCTADGLHAFSGNATERIDDGLFREFSPVSAVAYGGELLVSGRHSALGRQAVYVYDTRYRVSYLCDAPATAVCAGKETIAYGDGEAYLLEEGGAPFTFTSGKLKFGTVGRKTLEKLVIDGDGTFDVVVSDGERQRSFSCVKGCVRPNLRGNSFTVALSGTGIVYGLTAEAEVEDGV